MEEGDKRTRDGEVYEKTIRRVNLSKRKGDGWEVDTIPAAFDKMETLGEATGKAYKLFYPGVDVDPSAIRLVLFNPTTLTSERSWEAELDEPFGSLVRRYGESDMATLLLQCRSDGIPFEPYAPKDGVLKVELVDWKGGRILTTFELHVAHLGQDVTVMDLHGRILSNHPLHSLQLAYKSSESGVGSVLLDDLNAPLGDLLTNRTLPLQVIGGSVGQGETGEFLRWASEYFWSYGFLVHSQINTLPPNSQVREGDPSGGGESEPQFDFDPLEEHNTTQLTHTSPGEESNKSQEEMHGVESSRHYFSVLSKENKEPQVQTLSMRVSSVMSLSDLSRRIGYEIHQHPDEFILYGVRGECEVEYTHAQLNTLLRDLDPFDSMRTRIGRRLGPTQIRVPLFLLDFSAYKGPPPYLTHVVLDSGMSGWEMKEATKRALQGNPIQKELNHSCFRIRKKKGVYPGRILRDNTRFRDLFLTGTGELFVQGIPMEDSLGEKEFHVLVRHWSPTLLTLSQPFEVKVTHDYKEKVELVIRDQVSEVTGIGRERLEYLVPELDIEYPYELSPVLLQEKLTWKKFGAGRILNVHTDQSAIIIRDSLESGKEVSEEERREYLKECSTVHPQQRKAEAGLTINLSRTPPQ